MSSDEIAVPRAIVRASDEPAMIGSMGYGAARFFESISTAVKMIAVGFGEYRPTAVHPIEFRFEDDNVCIIFWASTSSYALRSCADIGYYGYYVGASEKALSAPSWEGGREDRYRYATVLEMSHSQDRFTGSVSAFLPDRAWIEHLAYLGGLGGPFPGLFRAAAGLDGWIYKNPEPNRTDEALPSFDKDLGRPYKVSVEDVGSKRVNVIETVRSLLWTDFVDALDYKVAGLREREIANQSESPLPEPVPILPHAAAPMPEKYQLAGVS